MSDRSFKENLDLLIKLFRKLKDKSSINEIKGIDKTFYHNFEYLLNNYEMMKDQISDELLSKFGEPVKGMIAGLVEQLKDELGEEEVQAIINEEDEIIKDHIPEDKSTDSVEMIDKMLKNPNLSEKEIDELLDRRSKLMN
jgi:uncharacterized FAD-dependent dehydrogenase